MSQEQQHWSLIIEGKTSVWDIRFRDLWRYRDLLIMFVKRDFKAFYKQTILGPFWFFIQPILTTIVFSFVFGSLAKISTDGLPQKLFYLSGITAWNYFADCITKTSTVFKDNANIFGKVYFPRLILPLSIVVSNLIRFGVQLVLLIFFIFYYVWIERAEVHITSTLFLFPVFLLLMAFLGLGIGLLISSLTAKYRDLTFLIAFGVQLLMYATTVIYPLSSAPEQYRSYIALNPMTSIIEGFRLAFLGKGAFHLSDLLYTSVVCILIFFIGVLAFNKTEKNFVDTV